jgi:hypothetical protein
MPICVGGGSGGAEGASSSAQNSSSTQPVTASEGGSGSDRDVNPLEPFLGMDDGNRRLHGKEGSVDGDRLGNVSLMFVAMMEERGLPHHLLGALGSRMHYMMQKSFSSSISSSNSGFCLLPPSFSPSLPPSFPPSFLPFLPSLPSFPPSLPSLLPFPSFLPSLLPSLLLPSFSPSFPSPSPSSCV